MGAPNSEQVIATAKNFLVEFVFLIAACAFVLLSVCLACIYADPMLFARSGSILVLVAASVQARNFSVQQNLNTSAQKAAAYVGGATQDFSMPKCRKVFELFTLFLVLTGTLIWGYGDMLLEQIIT